MINNYLSEIEPAQLTKNTLTGFLIDTIQRKAGHVVAYEDLLIRVESRFRHLRKTDGRPYPSKNVNRSVIMALSSTGVFRRVDLATGQPVESKQESAAGPTKN